MGSLSGHILPGTFFLLFGLWWCYKILQRFYLCRQEAVFSGKGKKGCKFRSSLLYSCGGKGCCGRVPVEAILIVVSSTIGIIGEFATAFVDGKFTHLNNAQHMTMYFFFGLMAVVSILQHYRFNLPEDLDYMTALLALLMEGILFYYHLHGRTSMDVQVHIFLVYVVIFCIMAGALEMKFRGSVLAALARSYFIVLQGTWFYHVGLILYPLPFMSKWDEEDHDQMMIITMIFTWHFAGVFLLFLAMMFLVSVRTKCLSRNGVYEMLGTQVEASVGARTTNGHVGMKLTSSGSEDDVL